MVEVGHRAILPSCAQITRPDYDPPIMPSSGRSGRGAARLSAVSLVLVLVPSLLAAGPPGGVSSAAAKQTRYSLAGGCYGAAGRGVRQGRRGGRAPAHAGDDARQLPPLPPRPDRARRPGRRVGRPGGEASPAADWRVRRRGRRRLQALAGLGSRPRPPARQRRQAGPRGPQTAGAADALQVPPRRAGCAAYPEAQLSASGSRRGARRRTARSAGSSRATCTG